MGDAWTHALASHERTAAINSEMLSTIQAAAAGTPFNSLTVRASRKCPSKPLGCHASQRRPTPLWPAVRHAAPARHPAPGLAPRHLRDAPAPQLSGPPRAAGAATRPCTGCVVLGGYKCTQMVNPRACSVSLLWSRLACPLPSLDKKRFIARHGQSQNT